MDEEIEGEFKQRNGVTNQMTTQRSACNLQSSCSQPKSLTRVESKI